MKLGEAIQLQDQYMQLVEATQHQDRKEHSKKRKLKYIKGFQKWRPFFIKINFITLAK
jgi:hypothetical protein